MLNLPTREGEEPKHLIGYGLVQQSPNGYSFSLEAVREFLSKKHKYEKLNLTQEEKLAEISIRRNRIEKGLRSVIKNALLVAYGRKKAAQAVLSSIPEERRTKLSSTDLELLLNKDGSPLFFLELIQTCRREWEIFKNIFEMEQDRFMMILNDINSYGRPDAHAKVITEDVFMQVRLHFKRIESILAEWDK